MNKELQNKAWNVLPKEFKEEVKKLYREFTFTREGYYVELFGLHNLTSDGKKLSEPKPAEPKFKIGDKVKHSAHPHDDGIYKVDDIKNSSGGFIYHIQGLIGISNVKESDLEPYIEHKEVMRMKPIESKISVCLATAEEDEEFRLLLHENGFKWNNETSLISLSCWSSLIEDDKIHYVHPDKTVTYCGKKTSDTLTFSEFKKQYFGENVNHRQFIANCDKQFDNILKDSFRNERRLNIATQIMSSILSNQMMLNNLAHGETTADGVVRCIVNATMMYTDALIAECELTEKLKEN